MHYATTSISLLVISFLAFYFFGRMLRTRFIGGCISTIIGVFVLLFVLGFIMNPIAVNFMNFRWMDEILFRQNPLLIFAVLGGFFVGLRSHNN
jgi:uncharacterized membrane-anchored protein YitT (DUF2179 family)